jgi:hypothetical protein
VVVRFPAELRRAAADALGLTPRLIAESPEEWRVGPVTILVDRPQGTAQVRYAREVVARAVLDPAAIVSACERALARLGRESLAPAAMLPALAAAYAGCLGVARAPDGARVPLVDMVGPTGRAAGRRTYSRAQFAWDLARLRRERRLEEAGRRVQLDVATGAAPLQRRRVVWIEDESGAGQYYGAFRLVARASRDGRRIDDR